MTEIDINNILVTASVITSLLFLAIFVVISVMLDYHWKKYIVDASQIQKIRIFYFGISLVLAILMIVILFAIVL